MKANILIMLIVALAIPSGAQSVITDSNLVKAERIKRRDRGDFTIYGPGIMNYQGDKITVNWPKPFPSANYDVLVSLQSGNITKVTRTTTNCVILVRDVPRLKRFIVSGSIPPKK